MAKHRLLLSATIITALATSAPAWAGPCSDDIATLGRQLSQKPQLGPATTGTLTGSNPGSTPGSGQAPATDAKGTTASQDAKIGGTAGTKELDAASNNVATSPADVRRQQLGKPTAAQAAATGSGSDETHPGSQASNMSAQDDHVSRAKTAWQQAVDLNAKNDPACKGAVAKAQDALKAS